MASSRRSGSSCARLDVRRSTPGQQCQTAQRPRSARRAGGALVRSALGGAACVCLLAVFAGSALGA
ncbi:MAG TPA: hypothetical protein VG275_14255, partial [Solirubrobacteraceae bacterium]|nr:hypothetical protein [Solirubrobacteraceae bacterium]